MASELSRLIEDELNKKGFYQGDKGGTAHAPHHGDDDEETPHNALMGALRVEARVKEHQHSKTVLTLKRSICIGGGVLLIIVLWAVLAVKSKTATGKAGQGGVVVMDPVSLPTAAPTAAPAAPADTGAQGTDTGSTAAKTQGADPTTTAPDTTAPAASPSTSEASSDTGTGSGSKDSGSSTGDSSDSGKDQTELDYEEAEKEYEEELEEYEEEYEKEYEEYEEELEKEYEEYEKEKEGGAAGGADAAGAGGADDAAVDYDVEAGDYKEGDYGGAGGRRRNRRALMHL